MEEYEKTKEKIAYMVEEASKAYKQSNNLEEFKQTLAARQGLKLEEVEKDE